MKKYFWLILIIFFHQKIYPGVTVGGIPVGGKTKSEATAYLQANTKFPASIILISDQKQFEINTADIALEYNFETSVQEAYQQGRDKPSVFFESVNLPLSFSYNAGSLTAEIDKVAINIGSEPIYPYAKTDGTKIFIEKGKAGKEVNRDKLILDIEKELGSTKPSTITVYTKIINPSLSDKQAQEYYNRLSNLLGKTIKLFKEDQENLIRNNDLFSLVDPLGGYKKEAINTLVVQTAKLINRDPQNPAFTFVDGRVKEFAPAKNGLNVSTDELETKLTAVLSKIESDPNRLIAIEVPVRETPSDYGTEDVNNLGIKERIGRGVSKFAGSIPQRVYNVELASSKLNGVLIKPGETFSFNGVVGDATKENGFQEAYIIKDGKTELGDGGGVCQTSTTLFRAVLNAGLPIIERRAHSYRVSYYEQGSPVGLDATTYYPTTDFKFKNDTPGHILIQTAINKKTATLTYDLYGTADGRVAEISKPQVTDIVPPPEDLYIDDPTLPFGQIKQIDWKASGAKVTFDYTVKRSVGEISHKTFVSAYQPWQAKFLKGTKI